MYMLNSVGEGQPIFFVRMDVWFQYTVKALCPLM